MTPHRVNKRAAARGHPIEQEFDLETLFQLDITSQPVGGILLSQNNRRDRLQAVFVFETNGFHSQLDDRTAETLATKQEQGLQALPLGERLAIRLSKFADDSARQAELSDLAARTSNPTHKLALYSDKARVQQLAESGKRQDLRILLYATWTPDAAFSTNQGHIEKALSMTDRLLKTLQPDAAKQNAEDIEHFLRRAYSEGYEPWVNLLSRMGLTVRPLNGREIWQDVWQRLDRSTPDPLPHLLTLDETGLQEHNRSQLHLSAILTKAALPEAHESYVRLNNTCVGAVTLLDKPDGWVSPLEQLRSLWAVMAQPDVKDTEIFVEFAQTDANQQRLSLQLSNRQANTSMGRAAEQNATDVKAQMNAEQTVAAQRALIEGAITLKVSCCALIYQQSHSALNAACQQFISLVPGNTWMAREQHLAYQTWLQTLPITRQALLNYVPFEQRLILLSAEAVGFMPLLKPRPHDGSGFELITEEGSMPIHLDFYQPHPLLGMRNLGIFGTTRSGKSVLVGNILLMALVMGLPVTVIDYPKPDGTSTYTAFAKQVGGAYFDVSKETSNLLELPDLSHFSPEQQQERLDQFRANLIPALMLLVIGSTPLKHLPCSAETSKSLLQLALAAFLADDQIMARARAAHKSGFGSAAWNQMPTLVDFLPFLKADALGLTDNGPETGAALNYCQLRLRSWIQSPGVGQAISQPSTVHSDAQLVVFALTNVSDPLDAAIMAISANLMALRRALASDASIFFIDESPILMQFEQVSLMVGRICANGGKAGIRTILSAQDPDTIAHSKAGQQILQNLNTKLIGRIQGTAIASFERYLRVPQALISDNASESFFPNPHGMYSNWLLSDGGTYTRCRFYPSPVLLALTANNPDEQRARDTVMSHFEDRPLEGLAKFASLLTQAIQSGQRVETIVAEWQATSVNH